MPNLTWHGEQDDVIYWRQQQDVAFSSATLKIKPPHHPHHFTTLPHVTFVWQHPTCIVIAVTILMSRLLALHVQRTSH